MPDNEPNPDAPADTAMMRIVHDALRRDLGRASAVLARTPAPDERQLAAIAEQLRWMMAFLEAHHRSEDLGLFPIVRERDPGAADLLDGLAADHEEIAGAIAAVATASPDALLVAVEELTAVLLPHLQREEDEVLPVVSRVLTNAEWRAIEQEHNLDGKSATQLAREGHWLIDGVSAEDRARVVGLVPRLPRLLLLYGFGPANHRRARACWDPRRMRVQREGSTAVVVPAGIDAVWDVVRDPTRVGEWSHECNGAEWVGDATESRPGARFRGTNRQGLIRWGRLCEIVRAEPHEIVWRTVPTRLYPDSTEWGLRLTAVDGGTRIEQHFEVVKGSVLEPVYVLLIPAHRDRDEQLARDLERIGALAGAEEDQSSASRSTSTETVSAWRVAVENTTPLSGVTSA